MEFDRIITTAVIHTDLEALAAWGDDNNTTFEPENMQVLVVSQKKNPYEASGITFNGEAPQTLDDATPVGLQLSRTRVICGSEPARQPRTRRPTRPPCREYPKPVYIRGELPYTSELGNLVVRPHRVTGVCPS